MNNKIQNFFVCISSSVNYDWRVNMLLLETLPAFEIIAEKEFEFKLPPLAKELKKLGLGHLLLKPSDLETISSIIFYINSIQHLYLIVASGPFNKIEDLYDYAVNAEWDKHFDYEKSFAVYSKIKNVDKKTVGKHVGQGIVDYFQSKYGSRPPVNLRSPDIKIFAFLVSNQLFLGIDLLGYDLNRIEDLAYTALVVGVPLESEGTICSLYSKKLCEFVNNYFTGMPRKERIVDADLLKLNIDQQKLYEITLKAKELYTSSPTCKKVEIPSNCPVVLADLVERFPSKQQHIEVIKSLLKYIDTQAIRFWGLIVRSDTPPQIFDQFKARKIAQVLLKGIPSSIVWIEKD